MPRGKGLGLFVPKPPTYRGLAFIYQRPQRFLSMFNPGGPQDPTSHGRAALSSSGGGSVSFSVHSALLVEMWLGCLEWGVSTIEGALSPSRGLSRTRRRPDTSELPTNWLSELPLFTWPNAPLGFL